MHTPPSPSGVERTDESAIRIGALVPLTRPGWVEAGRHSLAGLEPAVCKVNGAGEIVGRPLELLVRDTEIRRNPIAFGLSTRAEAIVPMRSATSACSAC